MTRKDALFQYCAALIVFLTLSIWIRAPGYMDAEYYTLSARQIATGKGLTQPIIWNYIDDPTGLPHPSHTYWMPAPSLVASMGMFVTGRVDFFSGRFVFLLISALAAPIAGWMGFRLGGRRLTSWLAAGFAIFNGYFAPYTGTIDSFFLIMIGAWIILYSLDSIVQCSVKEYGKFWLLAGFGAGWIYLNRADGLLWFILVLAFWIWYSRKPLNIGRRGFSLLLLFLGFLIPTGFWFLRNITVYGSLFVPNVSRSLWMTTYNELFTYPPEALTFSRWVSTGLTAILGDRFSALIHNLTAMAAVQFEIILFPLSVTAVWNHRKDLLVRMALVMELSILFVMSFVFPYSGRQGGFLHSSAALQPFIWGLCAAGFIDSIHWVAGRRKWEPERAVRKFSVGLIFICALITFAVFQMVVIGNQPSQLAWEESQRRAYLASDLLKENGIAPQEAVMINNPAGFSLVSGRQSIVIPDGSPPTTLEAANRFNIRYVILEKNLVKGLMNLYSQPESVPQFSMLDQKEDLRLFQIKIDGEKGE